jgi:plasmid rolling circle replication initiator protein Rep
VTATTAGDVAYRAKKRLRSRDGTHRDWKAHTEHLVQRGEILFTLDCLRVWRVELRKMNEDILGYDFTWPYKLINEQVCQGS